MSIEIKPPELYIPDPVEDQLVEVDLITQREISDIGRGIITGAHCLEQIHRERRERLFNLLENQGSSRELPVHRVRVYRDELGKRCFEGFGTDWNRYSLEELESAMRALTQIKNVELQSSLCTNIPEYVKPKTSERLSDVDSRRVRNFEIWFLDEQKNLDKAGTLNKLKIERRNQIEDNIRRGIGITDPRHYLLDELSKDEKTLLKANWAEVANMAAIYGIPEFRAVKY